MRSHSASLTLLGWLCGARERSLSPSTPKRSWRLIHFSPVGREIPKWRHSALLLWRPLSQAPINCTL
jgi:hypothetical protein